MTGVTRFYIISTYRLGFSRVQGASPIAACSKQNEWFGVSRRSHFESDERKRVALAINFTVTPTT